MARANSAISRSGFRRRKRGFPGGTIQYDRAGCPSIHKRASIIVTDTEFAAAGGVLTVDLGAVAANWRAVRAAAPGAEA
ncbi:MAG: hypothetical protein KF899_15590, partial [Parvibaculum sp.]|nr:hypothetical protein [Parvibaculum sp.]